MARSDTTTDLYDALAPIYDAWQAANDMRPFALVTHAKLAPLLASEAGGAPFSFVDLGCGTGTLLHALRADNPGWRLAGADASRGMLAAARAKPAAASIAWARGGLGAPLPFRPSFDAAGCFYDTLNHLPDETALAAALAAREGVADLNKRRSAQSRPVTDMYLGLHVGKVFYGNIGSRERLDFTVLGPAVNEASRIAAMCRSVDQPVLVSAAFAEVGDIRRRLISVGRYALRGVSHPQELFTIDPQSQ